MSDKKKIVVAWLVKEVFFKRKKRIKDLDLYVVLSHVEIPVEEMRKQKNALRMTLSQAKEMKRFLEEESPYKLTKKPEKSKFVISKLVRLI